MDHSRHDRPGPRQKFGPSPTSARVPIDLDAGRKRKARKEAAEARSAEAAQAALENERRVEAERQDRAREAEVTEHHRPGAGAGAQKTGKASKETRALVDRFVKMLPSRIAEERAKKKRRKAAAKSARKRPRPKS